RNRVLRSVATCKADMTAPNADDVSRRVRGESDHFDMLAVVHNRAPGTRFRGLDTHRGLRPAFSTTWVIVSTSRWTIFANASGPSPTGSMPSNSNCEAMSPSFTTAPHSAA